MSTEHATTEARLATSYTIKSIVVAIVCLVLGVWGVWDYIEIIPKQEREFSRADVCRAFNQFGEPIVSGGESPDPQRATAFMSAVVKNLEIEGGPSVESEVDGLRTAVTGGGSHAIDTLEQLLVQRLLPEAVAKAGDAQNAEPGAVLQTGPRSKSTWLLAESAMVSGARTPTKGSGEGSEALRRGLHLAQLQLGLYGEVEQPSAYDRPVQWLFILCLPFVPWYVWGVVSNRRKRYAIDLDGTLHLPGEIWPPADVADIDMGRWMKSSKAWVVHTDGHRVLLDDYIFKGVYRIVGELASARYPDEWTDEAKRVKKDVAEPAEQDSTDET
jgi:hypothetical protein